MNCLGAISSMPVAATPKTSVIVEFTPSLSEAFNKISWLIVINTINLHNLLNVINSI